MSKNLVTGVLVIACVVGILLVGCEDDDTTKGEASVATEELAGGSIKTTVREPVTLFDGTTVTQVTTAITHPNGTTESSVSIDGGFLRAELDGAYYRYSIWRTTVEAPPEGLTNAFSLWPIEFAGEAADAFQGDQASGDHAQHGTNDTADGRWVVISEGVSNSLEIRTDP